MWASRNRGVVPAVLAVLVYLCLSLGLNVARGAVASGFGAYDDEPSHLVTGLMVRDYLAQGFPAHPLRFAENYYIHYPKVALGQWPPLFYLAQAYWSFLFGTSHLALIALMSLFSASTALALYLALRRSCGSAGAFLAGVLLLLLPLFQALGASLMTEIPLALLCFLAAGRFGRFLEEGRRNDALGFGGLAILAILTKGSGLALALVPPLAVLLARRFVLLARPALWIAAALVVVACAPWFLVTLPVTTTTWAGGASISGAYILEAGRYYLGGLVRLGGVGMTVLAVLGLLGLGSSKGPWASMVALLTSLLVFYLLIPSGLEERNLVLAAPIWVYLAAQAAAGLARRLPRLAPAGLPLPLLLLAGLFAAERLEFPRKEYNGFTEAAGALLADPKLEDSVFLIASDAPGEGLFIGSVALGEHRPGHIVLRGSKVLSHSDWMGGGYESFYKSAGELAGFLRSLPVGVVLLDLSTSPRRWRSHHDLLTEVVQAPSGAWRRRAVYDVVRGGVRHPGALLVFEQEGHQELPRGTLDRSRILSRLQGGHSFLPVR